MHFLDLTSHQLWFQLEIERENGRVTGHIPRGLPTNIIMYYTVSLLAVRADVEPKTFETQVFENGAGLKYSFILHFHFDLFHFLLWHL
jgi:hypothetical protein